MTTQEEAWRSLVVEWAGVAETFEEITNRVAEIMVIQFPTPTSFETNSISIKAVISTGLSEKDQKIMKAYQAIRLKKKGTYTEEDKQISKACVNVNSKINRLYRRLKDSIYGTPLPVPVEEVVDIQEPVPDAVFDEVENPTPIMSRTASYMEGEDVSVSTLTNTTKEDLTVELKKMSVSSKYATIPLETTTQIEIEIEMFEPVSSTIGKLFNSTTTTAYDPFDIQGKLISGIGLEKFIPDTDYDFYVSPAIADVVIITKPSLGDTVKILSRLYELEMPFVCLLHTETINDVDCAVLFQNHGVLIVPVKGGFSSWFIGNIGISGVNISYDGMIADSRFRAEK